MSDKLYRNFDENELMDSEHYGKHVHAMTGESLHSKMDIAAELAFRDIQIERLTAERDELIKNNDELEIEILQRMLAVSAMEDRLKNQAKRDLEMKIKGVKELISSVGVCQGSKSVGCYLDYDMVIDELNKLTKQAEGE